MKYGKLAKYIVTCAAACACAFGALALSGCSSSDSDELTSDTGLTGGVAGSVNGEEIPEDRITRAINNLRLTNNYTDDDSWKTFLKTYNYTPESVRYMMLSGYVDEALVKQCANLLDVSVSEEEIDEKVEAMSSQYSSNEAWENAVEEVGYENGIEGYRDSLRYSILQEKINAIYAEEAEADMKKNKNVLSAINESISTYDGAKKSSMVLFSSDNEILAKGVRKKIADGEMSIEDAAKEYSIDSSTNTTGGDMGWDVLNTYDDEYTSILADLEKAGDVSKAIETENGWCVVELKDVYKAPSKVTKTSSVPEDFVTEIKESAVETSATDKYNEWLEGVKEEQDVVVNPMPENLPYDVDMSDQYTEDEIKEINDEAYADLVGEAAAEEAEVSVDEEGDAESDDASADEGTDGSAEETDEAADQEADAADSGDSSDSSGEAAGETDASADQSTDSSE